MMPTIDERFGTNSFASVIINSKNLPMKHNKGPSIIIPNELDDDDESEFILKQISKNILLQISRETGE